MLISTRVVQTNRKPSFLIYTNVFYSLPKYIQKHKKNNIFYNVRNIYNNCRWPGNRHECCIQHANGTPTRFVYIRTFIVVRACNKNIKKKYSKCEIRVVDVPCYNPVRVVRHFLCGSLCTETVKNKK